MSILVSFFHFLPSVATRSFARNSLKLKGSTSRILLGHHVFHGRVIEVWNNLPDDVVTASTISAFKRVLNMIASIGTMLQYMKGYAHGLN